VSMKLNFIQNLCQTFIQSAFVAAWFIGPRLNRYDRGTKPLPMSDPMIACIGLFILWWGWIGFNAGSSYGVTGGKWEFAARAGAGTTLASMSAGMTSMMFSLAKNKGKMDVLEVLSGVLSGLGEKSW
jgi:ammonium transporter, Amt family